MGAVVGDGGVVDNEVRTSVNHYCAVGGHVGGAAADGEGGTGKDADAACYVLVCAPGGICADGYVLGRVYFAGVEVCGPDAAAQCGGVELAFAMVDFQVCNGDVREIMPGYKPIAETRPYYGVVIFIATRVGMRCGGIIRGKIAFIHPHVCAAIQRVRSLIVYNPGYGEGR